MGNIPESVRQTADELNSILNSFISRHPAALKYRTTEDGYSIFIIKYGKYREAEIERVKEFINNTEYDDLLKIENIPIKCVKVNSCIMVFKGKKSEVEQYILETKVDTANERIFNNIAEKVKAVNLEEYKEMLFNMYLYCKHYLFEGFIHHYSEFKQSFIKNIGFTINKIDEKTSQLSINLTKLNAYYDKIAKEIEIPSPSKDTDATISDGSNTIAYPGSSPVIGVGGNVLTKIMLPSSEEEPMITDEKDYNLFVDAIHRLLIGGVRFVKEKYSSVNNTLSNSAYKTSEDNFRFNITKATDTQIVFEFLTEYYEEKKGFSYEDFNLRPLRWYELSEYFLLDRNGEPLTGEYDIVEPNYPIYKLNPKINKNCIVLPSPDKLISTVREDEEIGSIEELMYGYIENNIFIPVEFGEKYNKFNTYFTPTRYRNILSESIDYELITFDEAKEYFEQGSTICTFADGVTAETVVDPNFDVIMLNKHDTPDAKIVKEKTYYHYNECH